MVADLLARIAGGDRAALAELYRATSAKLMGVCLRILPDRGESEDALQEVYLTVWRKAAAFDRARGVSPITWLATIARNKAIDRLRARPAVVGVSAETALADTPDPALHPQQELERSQEAARLSRCIDELEAHAALAIRTAFFEGVTYEALATRLGAPVGTVKSWIRRGLARIRACLEP